MHVRAYGEISYAIDADGENEPITHLPDLKDLLVEAIGQPVRRISRFMQLALIGAGRCARAAQMPKDTAVYLASSRGDLEISVDVMTHVFRDGQAPKPLSFVNTVSNSAAFYVARTLQFEARSSFVCNRYFAFEAALQLAITDLQLGLTTSALIGTVDSAVLPIAAHRQRLELAASTPLAEGSHWIWLTREAAEDSLCTISDIHCCSTQPDLFEWLSAKQLPTEGVVLSAGQYLTDADFTAIQSQLSLQKIFDYREKRGHYASHSAALIPEFIRAKTGAQTLLHVNGDAMGRRTAMLIRRTASC